METVQFNRESSHFRCFVNRVYETRDIGLIDRVTFVSRFLIGFLDFPGTEKLTSIQVSLRGLEDRLTLHLSAKRAYPVTLRQLRTVITPGNAVKLVRSLEPALSQLFASRH